MITEYLDLVTKKWFNSNPRPFIEFAIDKIEKLWNEKKLFVVEAPTGYGKSTISATIALYSIFEEFKSIIAFPIRTLLEDQFHKFLKLGIDENFVGKRYMQNPDSRYLIKPITLTTVDTLSLNLFGIPPEDIEKVFTEKSLGHYFFSMFSTLFSNLVLDEVHLLADSTKSLSFLASLIKISESFDQKVILMSATLPEALKVKLGEVSSNIEFISFEKTKDQSFYKERIGKSYEIGLEKIKNDEKFEKIVKWIKENEDLSKVLVVFNTVSEAIEFYKNLISEGYDALLIHSRFTEKDKDEKIRELRRMTSKDYIVVATQVIEVGVDISSNLLITDAAPASSLVQRFGRFLRYDEDNGKIFVWFEETDGDFYKVYSRDLVEKTISWLKNNAKDINVHLPFADYSKGYAELLNFVYLKEDFKIDEDIVENFEKIYLHLESAPKKAIDFLFELGGSFIREGFQVPVSFVKEKSSGISEFFRNYVVPVPFELFEKMIPQVFGAFVEKDGIEFVSRENLKFLEQKIGLKKFLKIVLRNNILAFAANVSYDPKLGMRLER